MLCTLGGDVLKASKVNRPTLSTIAHHRLHGNCMRSVAISLLHAQSSYRQDSITVAQPASAPIFNMSACPSRAELLVADINGSMAQAAAAVAGGNLTAAYSIISSLHQRTSAWQQLPAHHQRRRMMDDLGLLKLARIDAPFASLTSSTGDVAFIEDSLDSIPDTTVYARLARLPAADFYAHTRLTSTEFLALYQELRPFILKPRNANFDAEYSDDHYARFVHRKLHPIDELLLWLYHVDGNKHTVLSLLFDIDRSTVTIITDHITRLVNEAWRDEVSWPSKEERKEMYGLFSCHEKAVACIDGTHCRIDVPVNPDDEDSAYSGYKHYHTQNFLLCCDAFGFIVHIAGPYSGSWNDKQCFLASDFMNASLNMLSEGEKLITDGGFSGFPMNIHPFSATELEFVDQKDRQRMISWNEEVTLNRSLNEHVNHQLKARAQALAGKWSRSTWRQRDVLLCAARFANRVKRLRMDYRLYCLQMSTGLLS